MEMLDFVSDIYVLCARGNEQIIFTSEEEVTLTYTWCEL